MPLLSTHSPLNSIPIDPGIDPSNISPCLPNPSIPLPSSNINHSSSINLSAQSINSPSATSSSRPFGDKHDAQIIQILATIPNNPTSRTSLASVDDPKACSLKDEDFHPVLRSQSSQASAHLHPQFLDPSSPERPSQSASAIPTGYGSPSAPGPRNGLVAGASTWPVRPGVRLRTPSPARGRASDERAPTDPTGVVWREAGAGSGAEGSLERNSDQWKQHRKNTHKEVERRRRETINEGITELKKIVPGSEKNKGEILKQAVRYIAELKQGAAQAAEQWALEKALLDQAYGKQGETLGKLARQCARLEAENESLRRWIVDLGEQGPSRDQPRRTELGQEPELTPVLTASSSVLDKHESESCLTGAPVPNGDRSSNLEKNEDRNHSCSILGEVVGDKNCRRIKDVDEERESEVDGKCCKKTKLV